MQSIIQGQSKQRQAVAIAQLASSAAAQAAASISAAGAAAYGINAAESNAERAQEALQIAQLYSVGAESLMHLLRYDSHRQGADLEGRARRRAVRQQYAHGMCLRALEAEALALRCKQSAGASKQAAARCRIRRQYVGMPVKAERCALRCEAASQHNMAAAAQLQEAAEQARACAVLLRIRKGQR